jgi:putative nucleotidyltransferase with HDIG domain
MGYIAVEQLEQGMVLNENVHDMNTRLLLSKGQKIAQDHIRILKIWGVTGVSVVGSPKDQTADVPVMDDENVDRVKNAINLVFRNADLNHAIIREIYKTCLIHRLKGTFGRVQPPAGQTVTDSDTLRKPGRIEGQIDRTDIKLPEAPTIISELNQVIADPLATSNEVAQVVSKSPSLTAMLLKIVNSAYYGFPSKIDRISRAVTIIGTKEISGLALGICVMQAFNDIPEDVLDMGAFIRHSLACGMVSRILAAMNNVAQTEQLFVSGLLHDIGKLIYHKYYPDHAKACIELGHASDTSIFRTEKKIIGMNHAKIAKLLLNKWNLPAELTTNIVHHHAPSTAPNPEKAGMVHLADIISNGLGVGSSGERCIPRVDLAIVDKIAISANDIKMVIRQTVHQFGPMDAIFSSQQAR